MTMTPTERLCAATPLIGADFVCADGIRCVLVQFIESDKAIAFVNFENGEPVRVGMLPDMIQYEVIGLATVALPV